MTLRWRQPGESVKEWLLPHHHRGNEGRFGLEREVAQPFLAPGIELEEGEEFHATLPPRIRVPCNPLHRFADSNFTCYVPPVSIGAPKDLVWNEILSYETYHEWNPFHRQVRIVEDGNGHRSVRMWVNFFPQHEDHFIPVEKAWELSDERVLYVDEREHCNILIYGLDWYLIPTLRVQVVVANGPNSCTYHSYDHFGSWTSALLLKLPMQSQLTRNFTLAAHCLRKRCETKHRKSTLANNT